MLFACHSYVIRMSIVCTSMYVTSIPFVYQSYVSYVIRMSLVCTRMSSVCHLYVLVYHSYVTRMSCMSSVYHSYVLLCHPFVTRLHSYVCHSYVTCMYPFVIRMSLVCTRMSFVCHSYVVLLRTLQSWHN